MYMFSNFEGSPLWSITSPFRISKSISPKAFAALTGFEAEITEVCRFTEFRLHPAEDLQQELEFKLNLLHKIEHSHPCVTIRYFLPDDTKEGGAFFAVRGVLSVIDQQASLLYLEGKPPIVIHNICEIDSPLFNQNRT